MADSGSSITWSRTSTSSSTSDAPAARLAALVRLVHPFPSILDGLVVSAVALLAGGEVATAARLGTSMTFLQFAIGALNDIIDAPADAGRRPPKAIPAGLVTTTQARVVVVVCAIVGLGLAAAAGPAVLVVALAVLAVGFGYDAFAKGTPWSWLPFAVGIPLLPVYGWLGVAGALPRAFVVLLPMAFLAGAALAIANARSDLETDRRSGTRSVATALGSTRSWWTGAVLMAAATALGLLFMRPSGWSPPTIGLVAAGTGVVAAGLLLGRAEATDTRRRAWEVQALGAAIAATGWVAGLLPGP